MMMMMYCIMIQVEARLQGGDSLGLVIRGGREHGLGIFVLRVDPGSVAYRLGLQVKLNHV